MICGLATAAAIMNLADEVLDHLFRDFKICNHTIAHRANGLNVARRAAQH